jgi:hypothetical protein
MRLRSIVLALAIAVLGGLAATPATAASRDTIVIPFDKHYDAAATAATGIRTYTGTAGEGGTIEMRLLASTVTGDVQHLTVDVNVTLGTVSFTARMSGTLNFSTLDTELNGVVTSGGLEGRRVREKGTLVDMSILRFTGTLWVMPND